MESRWDSSEAAASGDAVGECVYCTRLIGSDPALVLHGGGNSSVKVPWLDITGREIDALRVKGSGWDMGTIEAPGLTPLPSTGCGTSSRSMPQRSDMMPAGAARLDPAAQPVGRDAIRVPPHGRQHSHADVIVNVEHRRERAVRDIYSVPWWCPVRHARLRSRPAGAGGWPDQAHAGTWGWCC
jgi:hypothetical protein